MAQTQEIFSELLVKIITHPLTSNTNNNILWRVKIKKDQIIIEKSRINRCDALMAVD